MQKFQELTEAYKLLTEEEEDPETWAELFADLVKLFKCEWCHCCPARSVGVCVCGLPHLAALHPFCA